MEACPTTAYSGAPPKGGGWLKGNMYYAYIIYSVKTNKYYLGSTVDINSRLQRHNAGRNKSTKNGIPWKLVYSEEFKNRQEAYKREMKIKSYKGGNAFKKLVG